MTKSLCLASLLGLLGSTFGLSAFARPEIASGDQLLATDVPGCLALADDLIVDLGVISDQGAIDRTGYFEDGSFRILCYSAGDATIAIVFASHESSVDVASNFIQMALDQLARGAATVSSDLQQETAVESGLVD
jgi:hypothetical protein